MKFGDDWRGIFIRGDDAFGHYLSLSVIVKLIEKLPPNLVDVELVCAMMDLHRLKDALSESDERVQSVPCQVMKPIEECLVRRERWPDALEGEDRPEPSPNSG